MIVPNGGVVVDFDVAEQIDRAITDFCNVATKSRKLKAAWQNDLIGESALVEIENLEHDKVLHLLKLAEICNKNILVPYDAYRKQQQLPQRTGRLILNLFETSARQSQLKE